MPLMNLNSNQSGIKIQTINLEDESIALICKETSYGIIYIKDFIKKYPIISQYDKHIKYYCEPESISDRENKELERIPEEINESSEVHPTIPQKIKSNKRIKCSSASSSEVFIKPSAVVKPKKFYLKSFISGMMIILILIIILVILQKFIENITLPASIQYKNPYENPKIEMIKNEAIKK